ncbi:hypothetical protein DICPUDRAFT_93070, partial [Dictyostelium purpureum]
MIKYSLLLLFLFYTYITSAYNSNNNNNNRNFNLETIQEGNTLKIKGNYLNANSKLFLNQQEIKANFNGKEFNAQIPLDLLEYNFSIENSPNGPIIPVSFTPKPIIKYIYSIFNNNTFSVIINGEFLGTTINKKSNYNKISINNAQCLDLSIFNNDNTLIKCTLVNNQQQEQHEEQHQQQESLINKYILTNNKISIQSSKYNSNEKTLYEFNEIPVLIQLFGYKKDLLNDKLFYFNTSYYNSNWYLNSSIKLTIFDADNNNNIV